MSNNIHNIQEYIKRIPKKYFFLYVLTTIFFISSFFWYIHSKSRISTKKNNAIINGDIKIVAWDLHDVLFYDKPSMIKALWKYRKKLKLIPGGSITKLILKDFQRVITGKERRLNSTMIIKKALKTEQNELAEFLIAHEADCKPASDLKTYNLPANSVLFIDDKMQNCRGAQKLGMQTYHFKLHHNNKKDRKKAINEIYRALGISNDTQHDTNPTLSQQGIS